MLVSDLTVEVRDVNLRKWGQIEPEYLDLEAVARHRGLGEWKVRLPNEHFLVPILEYPGGGLVITVRDQPFMSGPMIKPNFSSNTEDPVGIKTFSGVDDTVILEDARAWPLPTQADVTLQTVSNDVRTGVAETVMKAYVNANIGPSAPAGRRSVLANALTIPATTGLGPSVTKSPRFQKLSELMAEIATYANLGFRVIQVGTVLQFQVYALTDRSSFIRFDIDNGSLEDQTVEISAPTVTRPIVAGQQEGAARTIIQRTNATSLAAEAAWGRKIEAFIDQRQTDVLAELQQAGDEALAEGGFTGESVKAVPTDDETREFNIDWKLGDKVTVVIAEEETTSTITEVALIAKKEGVTLGASIGDVTGFNAASVFGARVTDTERRVEALERAQ